MRIAINGFGRIGRLLFKMLSNYEEYDIVLVNDLGTPKTLAHLLKYDSIYGRFSRKVSCVENQIIVDNKVTTVLNIPDIHEVNWAKFDIDVVFECTGIYKTLEENYLHILAGAKKVILTSVPTDSIPMVVLGVNESIIKKSEKVISNASCTTNCAAPMIKVLNDNLGLESAYVTTVHSYTSDQNLHDGIHSDLRRSRSAPNSIIPTSTGAAKALSHIFPNIEIGGCGIRVPVTNGSLTDITCVVKKKASIDVVKLITSDSFCSLNSIALPNL